MRVQLNVNHFIISDEAGHQTRVNFSDLTAAEETELRCIALSQLPPRQPKQKRNKRSRGRVGSKPSKRVNYAELVCKRDAAGINENGV